MLYPLPAVLVPCGDRDGNYNVLTVAWTGTICSDPPMVYVSVRKNRYSHHILKETGEFFINLTTEKLAFATDYCGVKSGRDTDKFAAAGLTPAFAECGAPYVAEGELVLVCRKLYAQDMTGDAFLDREIVEKSYPQKDYHRMYVGEIVEAYRRI